MCGIFGVVTPQQLNKSFVQRLLAYRGPDHSAIYTEGDVYLAHTRLSIIGLDQFAVQPMQGRDGSIIVFNGEIYNYQDLKKTQLRDYPFKSTTDTEVILALYEKYGANCVDYLRGMFAFAIFDQKNKKFFCARDRFGIKPFYFIANENLFAFASEMKVLLPFLPEITTNHEVLSEYLTFQYTLGAETLFKDLHQLLPGELMVWENYTISIKKYWDITYQTDFSHSPEYFAEKLQNLVEDSVRYHQVSDVAVGSYLSGGVDSSLISRLAVESNDKFYGSFHGRFTEYAGYDESQYAEIVAQDIQKKLFITDINAQDFTDNIAKIIYHLDTPVAGPGAFPQYMVAKLASEHVKVVLGGQGGDEIFGGYARYVIGYFEQAIKAAIDGTYTQENFLVTPESMISNLACLREYKPFIKEFWREGLFDAFDERYFRLIDRSVDNQNEIHWHLFDKPELLERFKLIFNSDKNVAPQAYFDQMMRFDFKCLLPALLHVEDRMSMAHGLESRVPFLDHPLVEFAATIPANIKFPGGKMKALLKTAFAPKIPAQIADRRDKMGFPVPLKEWFSGSLQPFISDIFSSSVAKTRGFYDPQKVLQNLEYSAQFSRKVWGLLCLELWYREFHDQQSEHRKLIDI